MTKIENGPISLDLSIRNRSVGFESRHICLVKILLHGNVGKEKRF